MRGKKEPVVLRCRYCSDVSVNERRLEWYPTGKKHCYERYASQKVNALYAVFSSIYKADSSNTPYTKKSGHVG